MSDAPDREALTSRVQALENAVDGLQREIAELRGLARRAPSPIPPLKASPAISPLVARAPIVQARPAAPPAPPEPRIDFETLVGRYGMLALATLLALAAVGTFVGWAVAHGWLGPAARVVLGLIAAAALAVWGLRLRKRERSFGDSILGLSLAAVHVCAWAAGPSLHLVPPVAALVLSAAASVALAGFALLEGDE